MIDGAHRGPPEDVGSIDGYYEFLEAVTKPRHRQHKQMLDWHGGPYDPDDMNLQMITARLTQLARRRMIGKAAHEKAEAAAPERGQRAEKRAASAAKFMARRVSALAIQPQPNTNFTV